MRLEDPGLDHVQSGENVMSRISEDTLREVAEAIRPHASELARRKGQLSADDIRRLAKDHARVAVRSERSCRIVDEYLTGERLATR